MPYYDPLFFVLFAAFTIAGGIVLFGVGVWLYRQNTQQQHTKPFIRLLLTMSTWSMLSGIRVLAQSPQTKVIIFTLLSIAAIFVAPLWLHFATSYTGEQTPLSRNLVPVSYGIAGVFSLIMVTNQWHSLYWTNIHIVDIGWSILARNRTLLYWVSYLWAYLTVIGSIILVGYRSLETNDLHNKKLIIYVFGPLIPIAFELFTSLGFTPYLLDYTPLGFVIWGGLLVYVFYSHTLHNVSPIGRKYAFESIENPVLIYDNNGLLTDYNPQSEHLLIENPSGHQWLDAFNETTREQIREEIENNIDEFREHIGNTIDDLMGGTVDLSSLDTHHFDGIAIDTQGETQSYNIQFTPITPRGDLRGYVIVFYDITSIVEHKQQLEKQNERLEQFASIVSHDLRNPISVARGFANMIDDNDEPVSKINTALDRMEGIINQILVLTREEKAVAKSDMVSIRDAATDAWDLVNTFDGNIDINTDLTVEADQGHVLSVFENLIRNVYDHCDRDTNVYVGSLTDETGFYVADDGPGIPDDELDNVFDEGYTSNKNGNGLGLFIVKKIVDAHGWEIRIDNDTDTYGAKFDIITIEA